MARDRGRVPPMLAIVATALAILLPLVATETAGASFPGANGKIAFESADRNTTSGGPGNIWLLDPDGGGIAPLFASATTAQIDPAFSPDGRLVAYAEGLNLWVANSDGTAPRQVTTAGLNDQMPAFSPDGAKLVFRRASVGDLFAVNLDGTGLVDLTNDADGSEFDPSWSPDGTRIAYTRSGCTQGTNEGGVCVYTMNANGSNQTNLTTEENFPECPMNAPGFAHRRHSDQPSWSPDSSKIAFAGFFNSCTQSGGGDIWIMNADGGDKQDLIGDSNTIDRQPTWSPDGGRIAFVSDRERPDTNDEIWTVTLGGALTRLTNDGFDDEDPDWGAAIAVTGGGGGGAGGGGAGAGGGVASLIDPLRDEPGSATEQVGPSTLDFRPFSSGRGGTSLVVRRESIALPITVKPALPITVRPSLPITVRPALPITVRPGQPVSLRLGQGVTVPAALPITVRTARGRRVAVRRGYELNLPKGLPITVRPGPEVSLPITVRPGQAFTAPPQLPITVRPALPITVKPALPITVRPGPGLAALPITVRPGVVPLGMGDCDPTSAGSPCTISASGSVDLGGKSPRGAARSLKLSGRRIVVPSGQARVLTLGLSARLRRALRRSRSAKVRLTLRASNTAGASGSKKRSMKLVIRR
jgi:Tol biopolymer transport system component